jgi:threonine/homoserine/homoserine lactone efflux protein
MTTLQFLAIVSAVAINTAIPGPAIIHVFSRSAAAGFGAGVRVAAGMAVGSAALALLACMVMVGVLENGQPKAVRVLVGLSDGQNTEVLSQDLEAGDEVIVRLAR